MPFRGKRLGDIVLLAGLVGLYVIGLGLWFTDKWQRVGQMDVGGVEDGANVAPTRLDAAAAGLFGGGRALRINGVEVQRPTWSELSARRDAGALNTITLRRPGGRVVDVTIPVRRLEWADVLFAYGTTFVLGALFVTIGVTSFALRPFAASSWAMLTVCTLGGGLLTVQLLPIGVADTLRALYYRTMVGLFAVTPLYGALAFPVIHPLLLRHPLIVVPIYAVGAMIAAAQFTAWFVGWKGVFHHVGGGLDTSVLLLSTASFTGRCLFLAVRGRDPLIAQRARILVVGLLGAVPVTVANFLRNTFDIVIIDMRVALWALSAFLIALGYITVRQDLMNARMAVRRAVIYAAVVGLLTLVALVLTAVHPYAMAVLLLPLLYWWPRFDARLSAWLYPKRARFPELIRALGMEIAATPTVDDVLRLLAQVPMRLCDARNGVAFLLSEAPGSTERVATAGGSLSGKTPLADDVLVRLVATTRKEVARDHITVEPQYANIRDECYASFRRLSAEIILPIVHDQRVVGGLAFGPRVTGDVYESADLDALSTVAQQSLQAIERIEATERLRARELEFADLKRFFPPQIIDQVMARGGTAELHSQRKLVTVLFADLRGFTSFSDSVEPEEVMSTLAEYHALMGLRIAEYGGTLERFVGDGFMVFFNDPVDQPDHVARAARMAVAMRDDIQRLRDGWLRKEYRIDVGMGIHTGYATCGFIGYEGRRDYAVIGTVTNLAARLSGVAAGGEILISARVFAELRNGIRTDPVGELNLKGFHQPQAAYRLLA